MNEAMERLTGCRLDSHRSLKAMLLFDNEEERVKLTDTLIRNGSVTVDTLNVQNHKDVRFSCN